MHAKECIEKTGFFDEKLKVFEDWDFQLRLSRIYDFAAASEYTSETRARLDNSNMTFSNWQDFFETKKVIYKKYESYVKNRPEIITLQNKSLANLKKMADSSMSLAEYLLTEKEARNFLMEKKIKELEQTVNKVKNSAAYKVYSIIKNMKDKIMKSIITL